MEKNDTYHSIISNLKRKIYGTTIYIGQTEIETVMGNFTSFTFQDLIHKGYIIALCHGDFSVENLYTRMHSSCVTSETLRSLDCDCVSQLYGALKKIASSNGILFYLIQEGRGCGYVGKSRACMNVQYLEDTDNEINTFQAYEKLGMIHDYRQYNNVKEILTLMQIDPKFTLLTNNPDKIEKFKSLNMRLDNVESIEIAPNPFNQQYLHSKEKYGHILYQTKTKVSKYTIPHKKIKPFDPYPLKNAKRFIHVSSYYLPIRPTFGKVVLTGEEFEVLKQRYPDLEFSYQMLDGESYFVKVNEDILMENSELLCKPYWFKVNVFYDVVTHNDYLILEYGMDTDNAKTPIIRIHSESIFNRFPLQDRLYKYRYKRSLEYIIRNGKGAILILYNDGRGSGLGYYVLNSQQDPVDALTEKIEKSNNELGVENDRRDYYGALTLLKTFSLKQSNSSFVDVIHGESSLDTLKRQMDVHNIRVRHWIDVNHQTDLFGYESVYYRICQIPEAIVQLKDTMNQIEDVFSTIGDSNIIVTGIGSSESHARYIVQRINNSRIRYASVLNIEKCKKETGKMKIVVFSQGLSYNVIPVLAAMDFKDIILITTYDGGNPKKDRYLTKLKEEASSSVIYYPKEIPDDTLVRITGPFCAYVLAEAIVCSIMDVRTHSLEKIVDLVKDGRSRVKIDYSFISRLDKINDSIIDLTMILPDDMYEYHKDISNRFVEGAFIPTTVCKTSEFAHGFYQKMISTDSVVLMVKNDNSEFQQGLENLLVDRSKYIIDLTDISDDLVRILVLISILNDSIYQVMQRNSIDQRRWPGKETQHIMYDLMESNKFDKKIENVEDQKIKDNVSTTTNFIFYLMESNKFDKRLENIEDQKIKDNVSTTTNLDMMMERYR